MIVVLGYFTILEGVFQRYGHNLVTGFPCYKTWETLAMDGIAHASTDYQG